MGEPDLERYIVELEQELDAAKAKYNAIYNSVRSVDRFVYNTKTRHKHLYDAAKSFYRKAQRKKTPALEGAVTHALKTNPGPLKMILINDGPKRLNLIFDDLMEPDILILVTKFAVKNDFALRIITRNSLANPKNYLDILKEKNTPAPKDYSFYSDIEQRLAPPVHRLEISRNDVFVVTGKSGRNLVKELNLPTPKGVKL
ncbi:hypothetical protein IJJ18_01365 [Candidatus Saccharibacteria bacterium]|nr:hypothetical protein [Candidatus Saccharibacteria bacterium]